ncbi:hypothetical protein, partial [Mesomycoplasma ovipneumoniae]|uniref:hypothetical protein n=1 Tax=Mesomycoplasma ovipneumoniae TaxID=29562 RepID=UPI00307FEE43
LTTSSGLFSSVLSTLLKAIAKFLFFSFSYACASVSFVKLDANPEFPSLKAKIHFLVNANKQKYP